VLVIGLVGRVKDGAAIERSRIVHEDVEAATELTTKNLVNRRNQGFDPVGAAEVGANSFRVATSLLDFIDDSFRTNWAGGTDTAR
jgi:hypothetical protein